VRARAIPLVLAGAVVGREPGFKPATAQELIRIPAHGATMLDCCRLVELLLGAPAAGPMPLTLGVLEIISTVELSVTALHTATSGGGSAPSIEVTQIAPKLLAV
jgi:hypothetical protein